MANILGKRNTVDLYFFEGRPGEQGRNPNKINFNLIKVKNCDNKIIKTFFKQIPRAIEILHIEGLFKNFLNDNYDIIQIEHPENGLFCFKFGKIEKRNVVITDHNVAFFQYKSIGMPYWRLIKKFEIFSLNAADHVVTVSDFDKEKLSKYVGNLNQTVIQNGVDLALYKKKKFNFQKSESKIFIIGYHGNYEYHPNMEAARILSEKIAPELKKKGLKFKILLIGHNAPSVNNPYVNSIGVVEDLPKYLRLLDMAVVPLVSGSGTRLKILEYMASGIPVVSTSMGAEGLNVNDGKNILISDDIPLDFCNKIMLLANDINMQKLLSKNACNLVKKEYNWENLIPKYEDIYKKLLNK